jgi:hypothetical protein
MPDRHRVRDRVDDGHRDQRNLHVGRAIRTCSPRRLPATQALIGEQLIVGIGVNHRREVERSLRLPWHKPVRHMLDWRPSSTTCSRREGILQGEAWSFDRRLPVPLPECPA